MGLCKMKDVGVHLTLEFCEVSVPFFYEQMNQTFGLVTKKPAEPFLWVCPLAHHQRCNNLISCALGRELKVRPLAGEALTPAAPPTHHLLT